MESHEKDLRSVVASEDEITAIQQDYRTAPLPARERALLEFAEKLTLAPTEIRREDLNPVRAAGLSDADIVDAVHCIGYFNYINRVLDGLGVDPEPAMRYGRSS